MTHGLLQASKGNAVMLHLLKGANADFRKTDSTGSTPLHRAAATGLCVQQRQARACTNTLHKNWSWVVPVPVPGLRPNSIALLPSKWAVLGIGGHCNTTGNNPTP